MKAQSYSVTAHVSWMCGSTLEEETRQRLIAAACHAWPYARKSAWCYLQDESLAPELLESALLVVQAYAKKQSPAPDIRKLGARLRSQIRRVAKQRANHLRLEDRRGSLLDLDPLALQTAATQIESLFVTEVLDRLSPAARNVAYAISVGFSWREIATQLATDQSTVRRAFRREILAVLNDRKDDSPQQMAPNGTNRPSSLR